MFVLFKPRSDELFSKVFLVTTWLLPPIEKPIKLSLIVFPVNTLFCEFPNRMRETNESFLNVQFSIRLFDTLNIVFSSALKGAGDTRYVMYMVVLVSLAALVVPSYVALVLLGADIVVGWVILTVYVIVLGFAFLFRYLGGKWKSMRVIEEGVSTSTAESLRQAGVD